MLYAVILGLIIAIVLLSLIQKTTSGFTAAECDAQYTLAYKACSDTFDAARKACRGSNQEGCRTTAIHARQACQDAARDAKNSCMADASAAGDATATMKLNQESRAEARVQQRTEVEARQLVTPGATFTQSPAPAPQ
jgi:hypothetical protein